MSKETMKLALEAGGGLESDYINISALERFAELVRADEREACERACEDIDAWNMDDPAFTAVAAIRARSGEQK